MAGDGSVSDYWLAKPGIIVSPCKAVKMQRYWIEFEDAAKLRPDTSLTLSFGAGVTAWSVDHALRMIEWVYGPPVPTVKRVVENVDVSLLDLPPWNLGVPVWPGIWKPPLNLWIHENEWPG